MEELKDLSMEELLEVKQRITREINERVEREFKEDCKTLADTLREFLEKGHDLSCYVAIECDYCERDTEIDLWDYIDSIMENLEKVYKL